MLCYAIQYYCTVRLTAKKKKTWVALCARGFVFQCWILAAWRSAAAARRWQRRRCRRWHRGRLALEHHYFLAKKPVLRRCCCQGGTRRGGGGGSGSRRWRRASATAPALSGSVFAWRGAAPMVPAPWCIGAWNDWFSGGQIFLYTTTEEGGESSPSRRRL